MIDLHIEKIIAIMIDVNDTTFDLTIAIARLPEKQRVVVALLSAGFKLEDCGNVLGISTASVFYTKSIALDNLKATLKGNA